MDMRVILAAGVILFGISMWALTNVFMRRTEKNQKDPPRRMSEDTMADLVRNGRT